MKTLYLIGGPMGVGKTTACKALKQLLPRAVMLDGDWCWDADPFVVTAETKAMVEDNICHLLNNFLACSAYENIIFCWVMDLPEIAASLLARLHTDGCRVVQLSLVCSQEALAERLERDIAAGLRQPDILPRSLARLPRFDALDTVKLDTTALTPQQTAQAIAQL